MNLDNRATCFYEDDRKLPHDIHPVLREGHRALRATLSKIGTIATFISQGGFIHDVRFHFLYHQEYLGFLGNRFKKPTSESLTLLRPFPSLPGQIFLAAYLYIGHFSS